MLHDLTWGLFLLLYNLYIIFGISRLASYQWNPYISRKVIHIFAAGVSILLTPYIFNYLWMPLFLGMGMIGLVILGHMKGNLSWFQRDNNYADIYFCVCYTILLLLFWDHIYIAVTALMFMSVGDGVTGIIRNFVYGRQVKGLWGSLGMLAVCMPIGYIYFGYVGLIVALCATFLEWQSIIDDNISVPIGSAMLLVLLT